MVTAAGLLVFSVPLERWLTVLAGAAIVLFAARALAVPGRPDGASGLDAPISRRVEYLILGVILVAAALSRVVGWDDAVTPAFWFSQATTLYVGQLLEQGAAWSSCVQRLWVTHVNGEHESAILLPVLTALQSWLGARFGLPVLGGAVFGVLAVGLAWLLGRQVRSPVFGLLFAAFVAASPMQLMWSRLGSHFSGAVAHVLLALVIGYAAGRRESMALAAVAGLVAWASVYHYYAARVAIPLTFVALLAGTPRAATLGRRLVLGLACAAALVGIAYALERGAVAQTFWPQYGGYPGNKGERSLGEFITVNRIPVAQQARTALERYFVRGRTGGGWLWQPGMENGGLALVPTALLGALGLLDVLRRIRRQWIWLALAAAGLVVPALSVMTARRALVFDLAWAALAAHGVLTLVDGLGRGWPRRARAWAAGAMVAAIALWGTAAVFALSAVLPASSGRHIPFGEAGFGDGVACKRCVEAGRQWGRDIADGALVVAFDNDAAREYRISPGGLPMYGKIGALVAGAPDRFVEGYALMAGLDPEPPTPGPMFDRSSTDFAAHLSARIDRTAPSRLVWHFERPTHWERWLAYRLRAAGGLLERFATPLSSTGLRVVTPPEHLAEALTVIRELAAGLGRDDDSRCVTLRAEPTTSVAVPVFAMAAAAGAGVTQAPQWVTAGWSETRFRSTAAPVMAVGAAVEAVGRHGTLEIVGLTGERTVVDLISGRRTPRPPLFPIGYGLGCAVRIDGEWWIVEPRTGRVFSRHPGAASLPAGPWIGIVGGPHGEVVLASANQSMVIFDPTARREIARFEARVSPSVRSMTDECSPIAAGIDWIATVNLGTTVASFYDRAGHALGTVRLDRRVDLPGTPLTAFAGAGHYLGFAMNTLVVQTFEVTLDPSCAGVARAGAVAE